MNKKIYLSIDVCTSDILLTLVQELDHDEIIQFIIELDRDVQDWEVTKKLYKHFNKEMKKFKKEKGKTSKEND